MMFLCDCRICAHLWPLAPKAKEKQACTKGINTVPNKFVTVLD
jgi:hypothetical protein